jgi:hypothetical protein
MHNPFTETGQASLCSAASRQLLTDRAARWLLESGIQRSAGGVARYYRSDTRQYRAVSTEITGYAAATFLCLYRATAEDRCLEAAIRAGRYLTRTAWKPALKTMPFECGGQAELAYFFDLGIVARALLALWRATGDAEFLEIAAGCARSMESDFQGPAGFHPVLSLPDKRPVAGDGRWSRHPGCYQLKAAMAWIEAAAAGCGDRFRRLYDEMLAGLLGAHAAFLDTEPDRERRMDRLHAYCYFLEGLLPRAGEAACARVLGDGIGRAGCLLREIRPDFERSDVCAQLLRLRLYAASLGAVPLDAGQAQEEAAAIRAFQAQDQDPRVDGGFWFGRKAAGMMPFVNPVSTSFCVQALQMWDQHRQGGFRAETFELI